MTVDGVDKQLACVVCAFFRQGCVLKLLHGEIDIDVPPAFKSGCMLDVLQYCGIAAAIILGDWLLL